MCRRGADGTPEFVEFPTPTDEALRTLLQRIIKITMKLLARQGMSVEAESATCMAHDDGDSDETRTLRPLQPAACICRIAIRPRAGQKVLTLQGAIPMFDHLAGRQTDIEPYR